MTKITKVELAGFKSFRKPITVPFFDGMTAIVGENGSGKSNLFDAISFVMGRRSSQLRSDRLEHLIFNGGERFKPEDEASVTLHLSNDEQVFDRFLDSGNGNGTREVTLGRRITRKSSTYYFMGHPCTRGQIDEVLQAARIDPDGQQLIAQGTITDIIRRSAQRRREIIDDISGIAAFDEKKRKAIAELRNVKSKLNTHRILLAERKRRLLSLAGERDAALEYQRLSEELVQLEHSIRHQQRERARAKLQRAQEERSGVAGRIQDLEAQVEKLDLEVENREWEIEGMREEGGGDSHLELVKDVERIRSEILQKRSDITHLQQQAKNLQEMIDEIARIKAAEAQRAKTPRRDDSRAVQALLERKRGGVYGTIAGLGTPRPGFETAFETAAGGHLADVVVDSRETAIDCINHLKAERLGRARLLPLRRLVAGKRSLASAEALKLPGIVDYAINLVEFDAKYRRAFEYVLGDTIVAENLEALKDVDGVRAVTLDGDLQSRGGALTGGWRPDRNASKAAAPSASGTSFDAARKRQQITKITRQIDELEKEVERLTELLVDKEKELANRQEEAHRAKDESVARTDELKALRERRRETYQGLENLRRVLTRFDREEAEAQAELEALGVDEHEADYYLEGSLSELEKRIESDRRKLRRLEPVNMRAIDEYATYEREYELFRERVDALELEKGEIERLIGEIEDRKRAKFLETLHQVSEQFDRTFRLLFNGGSAALALEDNADITSGLILRANPPDKEPHVIDSLSGGEQTLVATAFLFAVQEYQQAPFFILDEIDAALDLVNTTRLAEILQDYAQRIQVIVVSHNEETVRHAQRAYGVTIKNGVSQVIALDLSGDGRTG
jgi:chromosome segregation protein